MEEKKVLNEEETEEVSGGRYLFAEGIAALDPAKKEELAKRWPNLASSPAGKEIPKELLDTVSGGEMSDTYMRYLDFLIQAAKDRGYTLESALIEMQQCGYPQEDINYVATHW